MTAFVESRQFGDATVTVISEETVTVPMGWALNVPETEWRDAVPGIGEDGMERFGQHVIHIAMGDASILVDTGFDDPDSEWGQRHAAMLNPVRTPGTEAGLALIDIQPEQITHVLITHGHWDHLVGAVVERDGEFVPRYLNARYVLGRADWEIGSSVEPELPARLGPIDRMGSLELIEGDIEVVPGVTMLHTPGESPGHYVVRLSSRDERFYALSDLFHHPCEVAHLEWMSHKRDRAAMRRSRERILPELVESAATVVFTHTPFPPWGRIVQVGEGYRWEIA